MRKIAFAKAFQICKNGEKVRFCIEENQVKLEGVLSCDKSYPDMLKLNGILSGTIVLVCDLSGEEYSKVLEEPLEFYLSDRIVHLDSEYFEEIVECKEGEIDFEEILHSELEMIRCDYHIKEDEFKE